MVISKDKSTFVLNEPKREQSKFVDTMNKVDNRIAKPDILFL